MSLTVMRLRHLAVDYGQNTHMPDSQWLTDAADELERLETRVAQLEGRIEELADLNDWKRGT